MLFLKADTEVKVVIGPVVDATDGFTVETTLDVSTADVAEIITHDGAAVTDISGNTFAAITSMDGFYNLTITAGQLATEGMLVVGIADTSLCRPVRNEFMVVNANVYDSLYAAATTDYLQVDTIQISSDATAADNLELQYDTTGLTGDTFPAAQLALATLTTNVATLDAKVVTVDTVVDGIAAVLPTERIADDVTFSGGTTTTAVLVNVDGAAASSVDDFYNGRVLIFNASTLDKQVTDITDYVGSTKTATITAVTTAVTGSHTAIII